MFIFMDENFILKNDTAKSLYHDYAAKMPIYDYHCHINVNEIHENTTYDNITQVWLYGDHYKWRVMRLYGIDEEYITGDKSDYEKFYAYASMMPYLIGNPVYHWTHLELKKYFDIDYTLSEKTAKQIWDITCEKLSSGYSVRDMIIDSNVVKICSTDDPIDSLEYHKAIKEDKSFDVEVLPTFRPDKGVEIRKAPFLDWVKKLGQVCEKEIANYDDMLFCLNQRIEFFDQNGCVIADHGLDEMVYADSSKQQASVIFEKALNGEDVSYSEDVQYKSYTMRFCAQQYHRLGWTMQLHMGAMRSNNTKMVDRLGVDTGFDSINDSEVAVPVSRFLDKVSETGLPKTLLYTLNPKDNYVLGTMMGNFADKGSKVQFGCAWWFNDQKDGMEDHLKTFANLGVLSKFVGMLTDSRSFLSYTRHEYFRRILCNIIGTWVEDGEYPNDIETLGKIVEDISFNNSMSFINK